jgi:hypothetical protein
MLNIVVKPIVESNNWSDAEKLLHSGKFRYVRDVL